MMQQRISKILKLIMVVTIITMLSANVWALVWANYSSEAYVPNGEKSTPIERYIVTGAGGFLQSYSYMLIFLNKIELSGYNGLDYSELQSLLINAIENMKDAKNAYVELTREAELLPYNPEVIGTLVVFNYNDFEKANALNHSVFSEVQFFLKKGNVRGIYKKLLSDIEGILNLLTVIKEKIDSSQFPALPDLYRMNQSYSKSLLFGQYVAEVFMEIKR